MNNFQPLHSDRKNSRNIQMLIRFSTEKTFSNLYLTMRILGAIGMLSSASSYFDLYRP